MKLGTLTITGLIPNYLDGLFLGYSDRRSIRFEWMTDGFIRKGKLYKTLLPERLIDVLGIKEAAYTLNSNFHIGYKPKNAVKYSSSYEIT